MNEHRTGIIRYIRKYGTGAATSSLIGPARILCLRNETCNATVGLPSIRFYVTPQILCVHACISASQGYIDVAQQWKQNSGQQLPIGTIYKRPETFQILKRLILSREKHYAS